MKQSHRVAKNASFGLFAAVGGGVLNFLSIFVVAHFLGVKDFGTFNYLLAFATVFQFVADFGLSNILVREMTLHPGELERLLGGSKSLLWLLFVAAASAMLLVLAALHLSAETKLLSLVMGFGYLLLLPSVAYVAVVRAAEAMEFNAIGFVLQKFLLVLFLFGALWMQWGLWGVVWCHFFANLFQWIFYRWVVVRWYARGHLVWDPLLWKSLIRETLPMGGGMVLRQFAWQSDIFMLTYFTNPISLGLFSGPFRIVIGMTLLSSILTLPLFPLFVRLVKDSPAALVTVYQRTLKWYCIICLPVAAACLATPLTWIQLFLGDKFYKAAPVLQVLSVALVPIFISVLYPFLYSALHIQKWFLAAMSAAVVARLVLGCWVIPHYGYMGESVIIAAIEIALFFTLAGHLSRRGIPVGFKTNLIKPLVACAVMGLLLFFGGNSSVIWTTFVAGCGCIVYLALLWSMGVFTREEMALVQESSGFIKSYLTTWRLKKGVQL